MSRLTAADLLTPGQQRAKQQRQFHHLYKAKMQFEKATYPQFFNGTITRGFAFPDGNIYIAFDQYGSDYQVIISVDMGQLYSYATSLLELIKKDQRQSITVKGVRGRVNEKGVCTVSKVTYIK